jgi:uncharacterized protein (DUF849 family)
MLLKAAINGGRARNDYAAVPVSPTELAADVVECLKAGTGASHLHVRSISDDHSEQESLDAEDVARTIRAVLTVAPNEQIGISTGALDSAAPGAVGSNHQVERIARICLGELR